MFFNRASLLAAALPCVVLVTNFSAVDALAITKDTTMLPLQWIGPVFAGGPNVTLTGEDLENIQDQVYELNPNYATDLLGEVDTSSLMPEGLTWRWPPECNFGDPCRASAIDEGINYIRRINGNLHLPAQPGCSRISCSWDSAIFMCHDRYEELWVHPRGVAAYAQGVRDACWYPDGHESGAWPDQVRGRIWDINASWMNVVVTGGHRC